MSFQVCPVCEKSITEDGLACPNCKARSHLDALLVAARYKEGGLDKFVHLYKYRFIEDLHIPFGKILTQRLLSSSLPIADIIVPVPLHPRRLRWRGFNQSKLLAEHISRNIAPGLEISVAENILQRRRYTPPQMKVKKYSERKANLQDAFAIGSPEPIKGKSILLVDDISTTGATLFECARILKENGAKKVFAAVISRQEFA